jgi:hypothetical protein
MNKILPVAYAAFLFYGCSNNNSHSGQNTNLVKGTQDTVKFFAITSYLKGQLIDIKQRGITPVKYRIINNRTDSSWVPLDSLPSAVSEFLNPVIDPLNMKPFFTETNFLDQTIAAYTYTYDPKTILPAELELIHWDLYIDQETNLVKRIYLVKKKSRNITLQLTWQSGKWCKTVVLDNSSGEDKLIREEKISWEY